MDDFSRSQLLWYLNNHTELLFQINAENTQRYTHTTRETPAASQSRNRVEDLVRLLLLVLDFVVPR